VTSRPAASPDSRTRDASNGMDAIREYCANQRSRVFAVGDVRSGSMKRVGEDASAIASVLDPEAPGLQRRTGGQRRLTWF
jgi:hypothetical protein